MKAEGERVKVVVPRLWPGGTVACLATGPSLTQADVDLVTARVDGVIAVNDAVRLAPRADILYACDGRWWKWHDGVPTFTGLKFALKSDARHWESHGVQVLKDGGLEGLDLRPGYIRRGHNSGFQAINVAVHAGAARILLLGYDMRGGHFFGRHPDNSAPQFAACLPLFQTLVAPLAAAGVEVINCTRKTAITCFRRAPLEQAVRKAVA